MNPCEEKRLLESIRTKAHAEAGKYMDQAKAGLFSAEPSNATQDTAEGYFGNAARELDWNELTIEGKLERLRDQVKAQDRRNERLQLQVTGLRALVDRLLAHTHTSLQSIPVVPIADVSGPIVRDAKSCENEIGRGPNYF